MKPLESKLAFEGSWDYAPAPESTDHVVIDDEYGLFIGGEFVKPRDGKTFATVSPATEQTLSQVAAGRQGRRRQSRRGREGATRPVVANEGSRARQVHLSDRQKDSGTCS